MNTISDRLSSLHLTAWILVVLLAWLTWGAVLSASDYYAEGFSLMNSMLLRDWLGDRGA